jgi:antitoxin component YwqK of YwqJK toxin-antitoxin module
LLALLATGRAATMGPPLPANIQGPNAGERCPVGTIVAGGAPPRGKLLFCLKKGVHIKNKRGRIGPVVSWSCGRCKDGIALHGHYILGKRDGLWSLVRKDGTKVEASDWHHGKRYGRRMAWYPDGTPNFLKTYGQDGKKHGAAWANHPDGSKEFDGEWQANIKQGRWRTYNAKGKLQDDGKYDRGKRHGEWKLYDANGGLDKHVWYRDGVIIKEGRLKQGQMRISSIDAKGQRTGTWSEKDGKRHGVVVTYFAGTEIISRTTNYVMGKPEGAITLHREDGTKLAGGEVVDGKKQCGWRFYDEAGKDMSREAPLADVLRKIAAAGNVALPGSHCTWTNEQAVALRKVADVAGTVAIARWLIEREVGAAYGDQLATERAGNDTRLQVTRALLKQAAHATEQKQYVLAALLNVAMLVEANRAMGGTLLAAPPTIGTKGSAIPAGPRNSPKDTQAFKKLAKELLPAITFLLVNREEGAQAIRKAGRITLGRVALNKLTLGKLRAKLK